MHEVFCIIIQVQHYYMAATSSGFENRLFGADGGD